MASIVRTTIAILTGAALFMSAAGDAEAYVIKRTSHGELVHWEGRTVTYAVDPSLDRSVTHATDATVVAMDSWSGTVGAPHLEIAPMSESSPTKPGFDEKNGIFYMASGYVPAGRALAITVLTYDNTSGEILDADVIFNGIYSFEVLEPAGPPNPRGTHPSSTDTVEHDREASIERSREAVYDLHHVIAHELGHTLGMNDEMGRVDALMYRYSAPNDASIREPASDDIAGLAELYSTKLEAHGNGCSSATVAPKKPSSSASHAALFATFGFLAFLLLRAQSDRRARLGFVFAAAAATVAFVPSITEANGSGVAHATEGRSVGHARAKVLATQTAIDSGLIKTSYKLATMICHVASCPEAGHGSVWGGTIGNITQEVGGYFAPTSGDEVDVSFAKLPSALRPMTTPLAGRLDVERGDVDVRVVTRAR